jgi:hypothetical protein
MTMDVMEIPRLVRELCTDLVVLCHSLSRTECVLAGMIAKNHRAALRTLLIVADGSIGECDYGMSEVADQIFNLSLGPEKLVAKVRSMLNERPQSRVWPFPAASPRSLSSDELRRAFLRQEPEAALRFSKP